MILEPVYKEISKRGSDFDIYSNTNFEKSKDYFHIMPHDEPHSIRRKVILEKYPQIKELYVKDPLSAVIAAAIAIFQVTSAAYIQHTSWPVFFLWMYVVGASLNHTTQSLVHDLTHYTAFENINLNRFFAFIANLPTTFPSAMPFGHYHRDHHLFLGRPG